MATSASEPLRRRYPWGRLVVTLLGGLAFPLGSRWLPAPGFDVTRAEGSLLDVFALRAPGLFAVGILPWITGIVLVELVASLVPRFRGLRNEAGGRATLRRVSLFAGAAAAVVYAERVVSAFSAAGAVSLPGALVGLTLFAGSALLCWLAAIVTCHGLGNGFLVMFVAGAVAGVVESASKMKGAFDLALWAGTTALVVAVSYVACVRPARAVYTGPSAPLRGPTVPPLASGVVPLVSTAAIVVLPDLLRTAGLPLGGSVAWVFNDPDVTVPVSLAVLAVLCPLCAYGFNRTGPVVSAWWRLAPASAPADLRARASHAVMHGALVSFVVFGAIELLFEVGWRLGVVRGPLLLSMVVVVVVADLATEWRARAQIPELTPIWCEERPWAIAVAKCALAESGIPCHVRSAHSRTLLQLFAAFVPMDVHVPAPAAARARRVLDRVLGEPPLSPEALETRATVEAFGDAPHGVPILATPLEPAPVRPKSPWLVAGFALAAVGVFAFVPHRDASLVPREDADSATGPLAGLELAVVDDDIDPLSTFSNERLPQGMTVELQNVPVGLGRTTVQHVLRIAPLAKEDLSACEERAREWLEERVREGNIDVPADRRYAFEEWRDTDPLTGASTVVGYRTVLLQTPPVLTGTDFEAARVSRDGFQGSWYATVEIRLTAGAAPVFERATAAHVRRRMAIVVGGEVISAPEIRERIGGGTLRITMGAGMREAGLAEARRVLARMKGR